MPLSNPAPSARRPASRRTPAWQLVFLSAIFGGGLLAALGRLSEPARQPPAPSVEVSIPQAPRPPAPRPREWWQGGTLHQATLATWRTADPEDKLATAADWLAASKWRGHIRTEADLRRVRGVAERLVRGLDLIASRPRAGAEPAAGIAAILIESAADSGPESAR